jgi:wyosine [tRNA(Phe)-imidazoG37] synthetase (radical SAM superfamily)
MPYSYVFGPVDSSRLGLSLGLDLLGQKICSFDCLYCESGPTWLHTFRRKPYAPGEEVLAELEQWWLEDRPRPDYITLGGLGEPCLNSDLGRIVTGVKQLLPDLPLAVLTNSSLLGSSLIRKELQRCQVILPSLDSLVAEEFLALNRPAARMDPGKIAENILRFKQGFEGRIYLEILLVQGINDSKLNLERMQRFVSRLKPERVDVLSMSRPGSHSRARPVGKEVLQTWRKELGAVLGPKPQPGSRSACSSISPVQLQEMILSSLQRRPQSLQQLARGLNLDESQLEPVLQRLLDSRKVVLQELAEEKFFRLQRNYQV